MEEEKIVDTTAETVEPKKEKTASAEKQPGFKDVLKTKIEKQNDKCANTLAWVGFGIGAIILFTIVMNYTTIIQWAGVRFGRALLIFLPHLLLTIGGACCGIFNKMYKSDKRVKFVFWLNVAAFAVIWLSLIWGVIIF